MLWAPPWHCRIFFCFYTPLVLLSSLFLILSLARALFLSLFHNPPLYTRTKAEHNREETGSDVDIPDITALAGFLFSVKLGSFLPKGGCGAWSNVAVSEADGDALPPWVIFNSSTCELAGIPLPTRDGTHTTALYLKISWNTTPKSPTAISLSDSKNQSASTPDRFGSAIFMLKVHDAPKPDRKTPCFLLSGSMLLTRVSTEDDSSSTLSYATHRIDLLHALSMRIQQPLEHVQLLDFGATSEVDKLHSPQSSASHSALAWQLSCKSVHASSRESASNLIPHIQTALSTGSNLSVG